MALSHGDTRRIRCPACQANNFLGRDRCFRCGGSLPPPEEIAADTSLPSQRPRVAGQSAASQPALCRAGTWRTLRDSRSFTAAAIMGVVVVGLFTLMLLALWRYTTPSPEREALRLNAIKERLMRERGLAGPAANTSSSDPLEEQARRELERLQRRLQERQYGTPGSAVGLGH